MKKFLLFAAAILAMSASAQTVVYETSFEDEPESDLAGWSTVDADGDGNGYFLYNDNNVGAVVAHSGVQCIASASWIQSSGALTPDNWLISPTITLGEGAKVELYVAGQDPSWAAEHYGIFITENPSGDTFTADDFVALHEANATANWELIECDLAEYAGKDVQIAIRHFNITDMFYVKFDDFKVTQSENTAINEVKANEMESNVWFDLQGRRYNERPQTAGIYVNNGKKVVIK